MYGITTSCGSHAAAGLREGDDHAMNACAIINVALAGKIMAIGGAPNYEDRPCPATFLARFLPALATRFATLGELEWFGPKSR